MNKEIKVLNLVKKVFPDTTVRKTDCEYIFSFENHHTAWPCDLIEMYEDKGLVRQAKNIAYEIFKLKLDAEVSE